MSHFFIVYGQKDECDRIVWRSVRLRRTIACDSCVSPVFREVGYLRLTILKIEEEFRIKNSYILDNGRVDVDNLWSSFSDFVCRISNFQSEEQSGNS